MTKILRAGLAGTAAVAILLALAGPAAAQVDDYADYQPQEHCSPKAKPGTKVLARWLVRRGGGYGAISRACKSGGVSEHKEGRAIDWSLDARKAGQRAVARAFLQAITAADADGNEAALGDHWGSPWGISAGAASGTRSRRGSTGCRSAA